MLKLGIRGWAIAAGLAVAGLAGTAGATPAAPHAATVAPQAAAAPAGAVASSPTTAAAPQTAQPASPLLAMDGAPAMTVQPGIGQPTAKLFGLQPQVTNNGRFAHWMHDTILVPTITIISVFVLLLLVWVVIRFRKSANPNPSRTSHNTVLEVAWTLIPVLILVLIAVPSIGLLQAQYKPAPAGAITLKATGNQWYWTYSYPDNGGFEITANMLKERADVTAGERYRTDADGPKLLAADNRVVLPVGVPIRLITTGADVIHSWAVPAFWIKLDAVPGRLNETSFTIEKPGLYFGQCSELCGARHGFMPIAVEAVPPAQFAAWVKAKGGTMPTPGKPSSALIPQAGAPESAAKTAEGNAAAAVAGPTDNAVTAAPVITQGATGNPAGAGQAGH